MNGRGLSRGGRNSAWQFSFRKLLEKWWKEGTENLISSNWVDPKRTTCLLTPSLQPCIPATALCIQSFLWVGQNSDFLPVCRHPQRHSQLQHHQDPGKFDTFNRRWLSSNTRNMTPLWLFLRCFRHLHPAVRAVVSTNDTTTPSRMSGELAKSDWFDESCRISYASGPKVILPLALPLPTVIPSWIFRFQDVSTSRWFPVISNSPFWTYSFLFPILQGPFLDLLLLPCTSTCYFCIFPSFLGINVLMLHESIWSVRILHYPKCQHANYLNISRIPRFFSLPTPPNPINSPCVPPNGVVDTELVLNSQRFSNLHGFYRKYLIFRCLPSLCLHLCTFFLTNFEIQFQIFAD